MINYAQPTITILWQEGDRRIVRHENGKIYPLRYMIRSNGLDWQYEPEYRSYKTVAGAKRSFSK